MKNFLGKKPWWENKKIKESMRLLDANLDFQGCSAVKLLNCKLDFNEIQESKLFFTWLLWEIPADIQMQWKNDIERAFRDDGGE